MVALNVVDDLYDGAVVLAGMVEDEGVAGLDDGEPLPVGVHLRGEAPEDGMLGIGENAKCTRRNGLLVVLGDGLEHTVVPVVGLEQSSHAALRRVGHQQHAPALLQLAGNVVRQLGGNDDLPFQPAQVGGGGIHPQVVGVAVRRSFYRQLQQQLFRLPAVADINVEGSDVHDPFTVGHGQATVLTAEVPRERPSLERCAAIVGHLNRGMDAFVGGEAEPVGPQQRYDRGAPLPPLCRRAESLALHERVEDADVGGALPRIVLQVQQLEACHVRRAQIHLDVLLVELQCPPSAGVVEVLGLVRHAGVLQPGAEHL